MSRIRISNFGPIKKGLIENEGWIEIKKVTVFTGNQGSGKSTVAKLISTLSWIEKAFVRGDIELYKLSNSDQFEFICSYQNIQDYFKIDTSIEFEGEHLSFKYTNGAIFAHGKQRHSFSIPKIMYVPAERNFVSAVRNLSSLKGLPSTLYTFSDEYLNALDGIRGEIELPLNDVSFRHDKTLEKSVIIGKDYELRLSHASSGFQSFVPLYIVSVSISESILQARYPNSSGLNMDFKNKHLRMGNIFDMSPGNHGMDIETTRKIRDQIREIMDNPNISEDVKKIQVEVLSSRVSYSYFINIVEEPEQNLYPTSQQKILNSLLSLNNTIEENKLVLTTHSPYLINYLTLAVKAGMLLRDSKDLQLHAEIGNIVPLDSAVAPEKLVIYELHETTGSINILRTYQGLPSDENTLNEKLDEFNDLFSHLTSLKNRK